MWSVLATTTFVGWYKSVATSHKTPGNNSSALWYSEELITIIQSHRSSSLLYCTTSASSERGLRARDHVTSTLASLHWPPILYWIQYKVALTMFFIHTNQCPAYLGNIVTPLRNNPSRQRIRSSTGTDYLIPWTIIVVIGCWSNHLEFSTRNCLSRHW